MEEEYKAAEAHIGIIRKMREDIHKQFVDDIRAEMAGGKKPVAEQMTDVVMGTGGGGPRGPPLAPGAAGYVRAAVDDISQKRQKDQVFNMDSPRGKRVGPKPGPYTKPEPSYGKARRGKNIDEPEPAQGPPPPPPAPPAAGSVGQKISKLQKPIYDKKGKGKGRGAGKKKDQKKAETVEPALNGLPNSATLPPPPLPPPNYGPPPATIKLRLVGKQQLLQHTTRAAKRKAAADALAAARGAADASKVLLPDPITAPAVVPEDAKPSKKRRVVKPAAKPFRPSTSSGKSKTTKRKTIKAATRASGSRSSTSASSSKDSEIKTNITSKGKSEARPGSRSHGHTRRRRRPRTRRPSKQANQKRKTRSAKTRNAR
jgi:hypothetical protein